MRAPADDRMEDYLKDENDVVFKHGMEIAEEIRAAMRSKGRTRYRAPVGGAESAGIDGWIAVAGAPAAGQTSRTSRVAAKNENGGCAHSRLDAVASAPAAGQTSRTSNAAVNNNLDYVGFLHEEKYEPNTEKEEPEDKDKVYDNNGYRYLPKANAICRRSAKARYHGAPHRALQRRRRPHRVHGGAGGSVPKIECVMQRYVREFYDHSRFLVLTDVLGAWPKSCVLSCCLSI